MKCSHTLSVKERNSEILVVTQNFESLSLTFVDLPKTSHLKEIPNSRLIVSLQHSEHSANMEIYYLPKEGEAKKIYSLGEVFGSNFKSISRRQEATLNELILYYTLITLFFL